MHTFEPEGTEHILSKLEASSIMLGAWLKPHLNFGDGICSPLVKYDFLFGGPRGGKTFKRGLLKSLKVFLDIKKKNTVGYIKCKCSRNIEVMFHLRYT